MIHIHCCFWFVSIIKLEEFTFRNDEKNPPDSNTKIEWDLTNGPRSVSCELELLDSLRLLSGSVQVQVRSLEISWIRVGCKSLG